MFSGFVAWELLRMVYLMKLPRLPKKLRVMVGWTLDLLFAKDIEQMISLRDAEALRELAGRIRASGATNVSYSIFCPGSRGDSRTIVKGQEQIGRCGPRRCVWKAASWARLFERKNIINKFGQSRRLH
jgi:hypothetical protein